MKIEFAISKNFKRCIKIRFLHIIISRKDVLSLKNKIISLILVVVVSVMALTACGANNKDVNDNNTVTEDMKDIGKDMTDTAKDAIDKTGDTIQNGVNDMKDAVDGSNQTNNQASN